MAPRSSGAPESLDVCSHLPGAADLQLGIPDLQLGIPDLQPASPWFWALGMKQFSDPDIALGQFSQGQREANG